LEFVERERCLLDGQEINNRTETETETETDSICQGGQTVANTVNVERAKYVTVNMISPDRLPFGSSCPFKMTVVARDAQNVQKHVLSRVSSSISELKAICLLSCRLADIPRDLLTGYGSIDVMATLS
jgi:hypothetical protein